MNKLLRLFFMLGILCQYNLTYADCPPNEDCSAKSSFNNMNNEALCEDCEEESYFDDTKQIDNSPLNKSNSEALCEDCTDETPTFTIEEPITPSTPNTPQIECAIPPDIDTQKAQFVEYEFEDENNYDKPYFQDVRVHMLSQQNNKIHSCLMKTVFTDMSLRGQINLRSAVLSVTTPRGEELIVAAYNKKNELLQKTVDYKKGSKKIMATGANLLDVKIGDDDTFRVAWISGANLYYAEYDAYLSKCTTHVSNLCLTVAIQESYPYQANIPLSHIPKVDNSLFQSHVLIGEELIAYVQFNRQKHLYSVIFYQIAIDSLKKINKLVELGETGGSTGVHQWMGDTYIALGKKRNSKGENKLFSIEVTKAGKSIMTTTREVGATNKNNQRELITLLKKGIINGMKSTSTTGWLEDKVGWVDHEKKHCSSNDKKTIAECVRITLMSPKSRPYKKILKESIIKQLGIDESYISFAWMAREGRLKKPSALILLTKNKKILLLGGDKRDNDIPITNLPKIVKFNAYPYIKNGRSGALLSTLVKNEIYDLCIENCILNLPGPLIWVSSQIKWEIAVNENVINKRNEK